MIYDVFNFFNELELLEIRLIELDDYVDQFVLVEGTKTFQNKPKESVYLQNKHLFEKWNHKITHVLVDDSPDTEDTWAIEYHQFNAGGRGMPNLKSQDIIMWCCTDEIPNKAAVEAYLPKLRQPAMMMQYSCGGYLNCWHKNHGMWTGSRLMTGKMWKEVPCQYTAFRKDWLGYHVQEAGWHFCNVGGPERYKIKIQSYAHKEYNTPSFTDDDNLKRKIQACYNLYDAEVGFKMELMPWNMLPKCIYELRDKFSHLLIPNASDVW